MSSRLSFVEPMKAMAAPAPPNNGEWLYEVKFDGFRVLAVKNGRNVQLWSRNKKRLDERFPGVAEAVSRLPVGSCTLDGEVCALDGEGRSRFQLLQNAAASPHPIVYYVFDLLFEGSNDLRPLPLVRRKARLDAIPLAGDVIRPSAWFTENPEAVLAQMRKVGAEGAIAKRKDSVYDAGHRSASWVKIKFHKGQEFVIAGYVLPKASRRYFGSLVIGYYRGKKLVFAGRVGTGFDSRSLREIHAKLRKLEIDRPMIEEVKESSGRWRPKGWKPSEGRWVKPELVCQVQFTEWTSDGVLRHPSFQGLRTDKDPRKVVREPTP